MVKRRTNRLVRKPTKSVIALANSVVFSVNELVIYSY